MNETKEAGGRETGRRVVKGIDNGSPGQGSEGGGRGQGEEGGVRLGCRGRRRRVRMAA